MTGGLRGFARGAALAVPLLLGALALPGPVAAQAGEPIAPVSATQVGTCTPLTGTPGDVIDGDYDTSYQCDPSGQGVFVRVTYPPGTLVGHTRVLVPSLPADATMRLGWSPDGAEWFLWPSFEAVARQWIYFTVNEELLELHLYPSEACGGGCSSELRYSEVEAFAPGSWGVSYQWEQVEDVVNEILTSDIVSKGIYAVLALTFGWYFIRLIQQMFLGRKKAGARAVPRHPGRSRERGDVD